MRTRHLGAVFFYVQFKFQFVGMGRQPPRDWQPGIFPTFPPDTIPLEFKFQFTVQCNVDIVGAGIARPRGRILRIRPNPMQIRNIDVPGDHWSPLHSLS